MGISDIFKIKQFKEEISSLKTANSKLCEENRSLNNKLSEMGAYDYYKIKEMISSAEQEHKNKISEFEIEFENIKKTNESILENRISALKQHCEDLSNREIELNN